MSDRPAGSGVLSEEGLRKWRQSNIYELFRRCKESSDNADHYHAEWDELEEALMDLWADA